MPSKIQPSLWHVARFYTVVVLPAAILMALEMVSSRLLAPSFGNSVHVWGSIISVFLAAMSIGYAWGGRLADRFASLRALGLVLLFSAIAQTLVLFRGEEFVAFLGHATGGSPAGTLLATGVLFAVPTLLLAMVSPFAVRLATSDLDLLGATAGRLYAISTAGSLAGVLGATFLLVPVFPLDTILRLLAAATAGVALVALGRSRHSLWSVLLGALLILSGGQAEDPDLLERRITPYQTLEVRDAGLVRSLFSDGTLHAAIRVSDGLTALSYPRYSAAALLLQPEIDDLLVLGLGGGSVGTYLGHVLPGLHADFVDIDPAVPELAQRYLFFEAPEDTIHIDDGRRFLNRHPDQRWDYIYVDTYIGHAIPFHMTTVEFFEQVRGHLEPGGVLGLNIAGTEDTPLTLALVRTLREVFAGVHLFAVQGRSSLLILANQTPGPLDVERLVEQARKLDPEGRFRPSLETLARSYLPFDRDLDKATLLSDRFAPVNHLLRLDQP